MKNWVQRVLVGVVFALHTAMPASAATFLGEFWDARAPINNLAQMNAVMAAGPATATFQSTRIDYPAGAPTTSPVSTTLAAYLGVDAPSLSGAQTTTLGQSVFRFSGYLNFTGGVTQFRIGSDDGFRLTLGGIQIASFNANRGFASTTVTRTLAAGIQAFELTYWENSGRTGVEFRVNNALAVPSTVPLPASVWLLLAALGGIGFLARSKQKTAT